MKDMEKPFLDHLEDLRGLILKCAAAIGVGALLGVAEIAKRNFVSYSAAHKWIRRGLKTRPTYKRSK